MKNWPINRPSAQPHGHPTVQSSQIIFIALGTLVLLLFAFLNRSPFIDADTTGYYLAGQAGVSHVLARILPSSAAGWPDLTKDEARSKSRRTVAPHLGRSVYYGALLYIGDIFGGLWPLPVAQAAICAYLVYVTLSLLGLSAKKPFAVVISVLLFTSLPFHAAALMPDIFTGYMILCLALLFVWWSQIGYATRFNLLFVVAYSCVIHPTNPMVALSLIVISPVLVRGIKTRMPLIAATLFFILSAALLQKLVVSTAVRLMGEKPISLPFLAARVIEDGPGEKYLRQICPTRPNVFCNFMDVLPQTASEFLFAEHGAVARATKEQLQAMSREQYAFFFHVWMEFPREETLRHLGRFARQLAAFGISNFELSKNNKFRRIEAGWPALAETASRSLVFEFPWLLFSWSQVLNLSFVCILAASAFLLRGLPQADRSNLRIFGLFILAGILLNPAFCTLFSVVAARYQSRVIWLYALFVAVAWLKRRSVEHEPALIEHR
ncbi:MAG TPA: hypothetical protein PLP17_00815 [Oligoflexia bacterium]|nr:hypothetical protein [Oligoflexia bacterium]